MHCFLFLCAGASVVSVFVKVSAELCMCVQMSRFYFQTDHYNHLMLNFFSLSLSEESTRICHNSFCWLVQCLLHGNMTLLNILHEKVTGICSGIVQRSTAAFRETQTLI